MRIVSLLPTLMFRLCVVLAKFCKDWLVIVYCLSVHPSLGTGKTLPSRLPKFQVLTEGMPLPYLKFPTKKTLQSLQVATFLIWYWWSVDFIHFHALHLATRGHSEGQDYHSLCILPFYPVLSSASSVFSASMARTLMWGSVCFRDSLLQLLSAFLLMPYRLLKGTIAPCLAQYVRGKV